MPFLTVRYTETQEFVYGNNIQKIVRPVVGSKLYRIDRKTKNIYIYIVTTICTKKSGKNANVVDTIYLHMVTNELDEHQIEYDSERSIILYLNNHGNWWTTLLNKEYKHSWNSSPSRISSLRKTITSIFKKTSKVKPISLIK